MKEIDFLPDRYRQQNTLRKARVWRVVVLLVFGAGISAAAVGQLTLKSSAAARLRAIQPQHHETQAACQRRDLLQAQLAEVEHTAKLYAYLRHPWPRTRLLATVVDSLPPEVVFTDLSITRQTPPNVRRDNRRNEVRSEQQQQDNRPAPLRDLAQLMEEVDGTRCVVNLAGYTTDLAALHAYLAKLSEAELIAKAELTSLESAKNEKLGGASLFGLRLVVRPGYADPANLAKEEPSGKSEATDGGPAS